MKCVIYIQWVVGSMNGAYNSAEEVNAYRATVTEHVTTIKSIIDKRGLTVYQC